MENNRKDRIWEEDIPMRKLTVDDAVLFNLKKIYFRQVEELCAPVLKKAGYSVGKIGFRNVNVLANCPFVQELRFYDCVGGVLSLFVFKASRGGGDFLAEVEDAAALVKATQVDSLAVGIGSAHGLYKGKPELNFKRLAEINKAVDTPLVLHGGTGIPQEDIQRAIKEGINKVNVGTIIHCTYMNNLREELNRAGDNPYTLDVMKAVYPKVKEVVKRWIRVCMANGKA